MLYWLKEMHQNILANQAQRLSRDVDVSVKMSATVSAWKTGRDHLYVVGSPPPAQPFYGPFSGTTRVSQCQKRTSGLYGVTED